MINETIELFLEDLLFEEEWDRLTPAPVASDSEVVRALADSPWERMQRGET